MFEFKERGTYQIPSDIDLQQMNVPGATPQERSAKYEPTPSKTPLVFKGAYVCMYLCMYVYICVYGCVCGSACMCFKVHDMCIILVPRRKKDLRNNSRLHLKLPWFLRVRMYVCMYVYIGVCVCVYLCIYGCVCGSACMCF
jgi:hypothetical protein